MKRILKTALVPALAWLLAATPAQAIVFDVERIVPGIDLDQFFIDVTDAGNNQVLFTFLNTGPVASAITDVYFDDGTLLSIAQLIDADDGLGGDPGVDFSVDASPSDLPNGTLIGFTADFSADADAPPTGSGVDPGESLGVLFNLLPGQTFADTIAALNSGEDLVIGLRVQGAQGGGSGSYATNVDAAVIPEPASLILLGSGLTGLGLFRRRKRT